MRELLSRSNEGRSFFIAHEIKQFMIEDGWRVDRAASKKASWRKGDTSDKALYFLNKKFGNRVINAKISSGFLGDHVTFSVPPNTAAAMGDASREMDNVIGVLYSAPGETIEKYIDRIGKEAKRLNGVAKAAVKKNKQDEDVMYGWLDGVDGYKAWRHDMDVWVKYIIGAYGGEYMTMKDLQYYLGQPQYDMQPIGISRTKFRNTIATVVRSLLKKKVIIEEGSGRERTYRWNDRNPKPSKMDTLKSLKKKEY